MGIDRIPGQTGYLVINHEGAVLSVSPLYFTNRYLTFFWLYCFFVKIICMVIRNQFSFCLWIFQSAGELENDEKTASAITHVVKHSAHVPLSTDPAETFKRISCKYEYFFWAPVYILWTPAVDSRVIEPWFIRS